MPEGKELGEILKESFLTNYSNSLCKYIFFIIYILNRRRLTVEKKKIKKKINYFFKGNGLY